jgi:predicted AAA+ superfamily ATPase
VVLRGPRRVGKTELLLQLAGWLLTEVRLAPSRLLYVDLSDPLLARTGQGVELLAELMAAWRYGEGAGPRIALVDELQSVPGWDAWLKHTLDWHPDLRVIATGSSSLRLADGGRESGRGRWDDITVEGLTFPERLELLVSGEDDTPELVLERRPEALQEHLELGGLPEYLRSLESRAEIRRHMRTEIDREIGAELASVVREVDVTRRLFLLIARESGNQHSRTKLAGSLGVERPTLDRHIEGLADMLLIHRLGPFPVNADATPLSQRQRLRDDKIYLAEPGHIGAYAVTNEPLDNGEIAGRIYETVVYHALRSAQRELGYEELGYLRRTAGEEIDFVLAMPSGLVGVEVTASRRADKKIASARKAGERFDVPVLVVTAAHAGFTDSELPHVGLEQFLLDPVSIIRRLLP